MSAPLVSVIMGVYNGASTLDACINSIIRQSYTSWELIVCDDCSTDETYSKLKEWMKKDERIVVLHNNVNHRLAYSLNECLKECKGKYIARMDVDDESLPNRFETQVEFLEKNKAYDVVGCSRIIFDEKGEKGIRIAPEYPDAKLLVKDTPFAHPTIMMRREAYETLGGYVSNQKTIRAEDLELWFRFYENGYKGYNIQEPLYKYRESLEDYKKRTIKAGIETAKVFLAGYKKLHFPLYMRVFALKPILAAIIPDFIMEWYHRGK